jgi:hypothetical protein
MRPTISDEWITPRGTPRKDNIQRVALEYEKVPNCFGKHFNESHICNRCWCEYNCIIEGSR